MKKLKEQKNLYFMDDEETIGIWKKHLNNQLFTTNRFNNNLMAAIGENAIIFGLPQWADWQGLLVWHAVSRPPRF